MCDALFEILALQACQHFTLGYIKCFAERLEHRVVNLPFHNACRTRTRIRSHIARVLVYLCEKYVLSETLMDQPHTKRLGRIDHPRGKKQIERVCVPHEPRQDPSESVLSDQAAAREPGTELCGVRRESQIAVQRNHQPESNYRTIDRGNPRFADGGKVRIFFEEVRSDTVGRS